MPYQAPPNRAYGTLGAVYASGGTTLTLAFGHGTRFGTLPAGSWFWVLIEDKNETIWNRFMIAKVTAIAGDSLAITPAEDGTSNSNFPITGGNPIQKVQVYAGHSIRQLRAMMDGFGAIIQATAPTLTVDSPRTLILTPVAPITVTLPTTGVWAGMPFRIVNLGTVANTITVNASGGTTVAVIPGGANLEIIAYQDAPTTNAHWGPPSLFLSLKGKAAVPLTPPTGYVNVDADTTELLGASVVVPQFVNPAGGVFQLGGGGSTAKLSGIGLETGESYASGTGTDLAAVNTAGSIVAATLPAGALNALGRRVRYTCVLKPTGGNPVVVTPYFGPNGTSADIAIPSAGVACSSFDRTVMVIVIEYLTPTTFNAIVSSNTYGAASSGGVTNQTIASAGTFTGALKLTLGQSQVVGCKSTLTSLIPEILG